MEAPTLRPSLEEFKDFNAYIASITDLGMLHGIVKVVPPAGWASFSKRKQHATIDTLTLTPIQQAIGRAGRGAYRLGIVDLKPVPARRFLRRGSKTPPPFDPAEASFEDMERAFWKSISTYAKPPQYGADVLGSLMCDQAASGWNLDKLDTVLSQCAGKALGGITRAMLYFGTWRSMFAWHKEDMDLFSINYLHSGLPKCWYAVPCASAGRFEAAAAGFFTEEAQGCREYLRHKTSMMSPSILKASNVPYCTAVQREGEFVITFPKGYHAGFNAGVNIAEAVNFASEAWVPLGEAAATRRCKCNPDAVHIDMQYFTWRLQLLKQGVSPSQLPSDEQCAAALAQEEEQQARERGDTAEGAPDALQQHIRLRLGPLVVCDPPHPAAAAVAPVHVDSIRAKLGLPPKGGTPSPPQALAAAGPGVDTVTPPALGGSKRSAEQAGMQEPGAGQRQLHPRQAGREVSPHSTPATQVRSAAGGGPPRPRALGGAGVTR